MDENINPQEMLNEVNEAIRNILIGGQSYRMGSRQLTRADLNQLYKMKNDLMAQLNNQNDNQLFDDTYVAVFSGR